MDGEKRYWRARYDEAAAQFTEDWRVGRWGSVHYYGMVGSCLGRILAPLEGRGLRVLDVCCGTGSLLESLRERGFDTAGLDNSIGVLERLKAHPTRRCLQVLQADAARLPFADASFDLVVSIGMLQCFHDTEDYLAELARVLAPETGRLLLLFSPDAWLVNRRMAAATRRGDGDMPHYRLHHPKRVVHTLQSLGFNPVCTRSLFYVFYAPLLRPLLRFMNAHMGQRRFLAPFATSCVVFAGRQPSEPRDGGRSQP